MMKFSTHEMTFILIFILGWIGENRVSGKKCKDVFAKKTCSYLAKHGTCRSHKKRMEVLCRKTCKLCRKACEDIKCSYGQVCLVNHNYTAYCKCVINCTAADKRRGPVCARNGKTYQTTCAMKKAQCTEKKALRVYHYGNCMQHDECVDSMPKMCENLREKGACSSSGDLMQFYCPLTCRMCRQPAPPPMCYFARYGCCWNSEAAARGPNQQGCDACKDKSFCRHFKDLCSKGRNMAVMRQFCPKTCGYC